MFRIARGARTRSPETQKSYGLQTSIADQAKETADIRTNKYARTSGDRYPVLHPERPMKNERIYAIVESEMKRVC
jgi:hypothetical protein